jgi:hypothetical protein
VTRAIVLLFGVVYAVIGVGVAELAELSGTNPILWRRLAWLISAVAFAAHIAYDHFRQRRSPRITATHASIAAAIGAFGLALAANVHEWSTASRYRPSLVISLVAWPLLVLVPAFVAALIAASVLNRWHRRS